MPSSRPSLKNIENVVSVHSLRLLSFPNRLGEAQVLQNLGKDLVEQLTLFVQRLGERPPLGVASVLGY